MSQEMDNLEMLDEGPEENSTHFLQNFLARWQKFTPEHLTMHGYSTNIVVHRFLEILRQMKDTSDPRIVLESIIDACIDAIPVEKAYLLLRNKDGKLRIALSKGAFATDQALIADSALLQEILRHKESVCIDSAHDTSSRTLLEQNFRWFLPIKTRKYFFGILYLEGKETHETPEKFAVAQTLSEMASEIVSKAQIIQEKNGIMEFVNRMQEKVVYYDKLAMRGKLAGPIGHELNNLMSIFVGNLELLKTIFTSGDNGEQIIERIDCMEGALQNASRLVQGLFGCSKIEPILEPCALNTLVDDFIRLVGQLYRKAGAQLNAELNEDVPEVVADEGQIRQVLFNLVKNSLATRPDATVTISTFFSAEEGRVKLKVCDDGPGIPKEKIAKLFAPLYLEKDNGHGFGLFICKEIIDKHRGSITVESIIGKGTDFTISLPQYCENNKNVPTIIEE